MAKQGMKRPEITKWKKKNEVPPVAELQGKAKHTKAPARPIVAGTSGPSEKVFHTGPQGPKPGESPRP